MTTKDIIFRFLIFARPFFIFYLINQPCIESSIFMGSILEAYRITYNFLLDGCVQDYVFIRFPLISTFLKFLVKDNLDV